MDQNYLNRDGTSSLKSTDNNTVESNEAITKIKSKTNSMKETDATSVEDTIDPKLLQYDKRKGAMSVTGQLYESKLLTLVLLRFINDIRITEFYLGANISGAGALDDLCFRYKTSLSTKDAIVFLQAKHKINPDKGKITMLDLCSNVSDFSVEKHFESYLMIRQKFTPKSKDIVFKNAYHDTACYYLVYTPLKHELESKKPLKLNDTEISIKDLIDTNRSGDIFHLDRKDFGFLTRNFVEKRVKQLGKTFVDVILTGNCSTMDDEYIKTYHVVLEQEVINVNVKQGAIKGSFRPEFFDNKEKLLTIFKESLYHEVVSNKALNAANEDISLLYKIRDCTSAENISKVIGNVVYYDDKTNLLVLLNEKLKGNKELEFLKHNKVELSTVRNAVNIRGKEVLQQLEFNLPVGFGNSDITLKGNAKKMDNRLDFLVVRLQRLFKSAISSNGVNLIDVDESMVGPGLVERGVVEHNGGLGSALGNLLVWDRDTDALKFNSNEPLPELAKKLWDKLKANDSVEHLSKYRFKFRIECFPKVYFEDSWYEEYLVKDFTDHYWLCTGQAKEDAVENISKKEVNKYIKAHVDNRPTFRAKTDAIFLMLHDIVQKWWMLPVKANYLTENTTYVQKAMSEVVDNPLLSVLNLICVNKLTNTGLEFDNEAVRSLGLDAAYRGVVLIDTDTVSHTAVKLIQLHKHTQNCSFIDFNYVTNLMFCNLHDLAQEVKSSNIDKFVITCKDTGKAENNESLCEMFAHFLLDLKMKDLIVIMDGPLLATLKQNLVIPYKELKDSRNSLTDVSQETKTKILSESKIIYQGEEVNLESIIDEDSTHLITSQMLQKLVNKETIIIGKPLTTSSYNKIREYYVERNIIAYSKYNDSNNPNKEVSVPFVAIVSTLMDIAKDITVITAPPGMGKSTLLTHLSLETKKKHPDVWIARINLLSHSKTFHVWKKYKTIIDKAQVLSFLCKAVSSRDTEYEFANTDKGIAVSNTDMNSEDDLQVNLFLHCYKTGKAVIIFDGFDEICPLYEEEVIQLIKVSANESSDTGDIKPKLWIASRSYNNVKHVIEREFGLSYSLEPLSKMEHQIYLHKLWRKNMQIAEFTYEQLRNVDSFIDYMRQFWHVPGERIKPVSIKPIAVALYEIYFVAVQYFQDGIRNVLLTPDKEIFKGKWNLLMGYPSYRRYDGNPDRLNADFSYIRSSCHITGSPLQTHIAAEFFENQIKYNLKNYDSQKWDLGNNTFFIYERFLETKLLKIRFEEKNCIDIYNPDNIGMHERERKEFIDMHRKLAFYSIFQERSSALMSQKKLTDIQNMIDKIKYATEKTGVIDCIVDNVPRFVHLIFAEYFAVDYVSNMLKMAFVLKREDKQQLIWRFLLSPAFREATIGLTNIFDYKLILDPKLKEIMEDQGTQRIAYDALMDHASDTDGDPNKTVWNNLETLYYDILARGMKYTSGFLLKCIIRYLDRNDVDKFVSLISYRQFLGYALHTGLEDIVRLSLDYLREIDLMQLYRALKYNGLIYGPELLMLTNDQIIMHMRAYIMETRFKMSSKDNSLPDPETVTLLGAVKSLR